MAIPSILSGQSTGAELKASARSHEFLQSLAIFEEKLANHHDSLDFYAAKVQRQYPQHSPSDQAKALYLLGDYFKLAYLEYDSAQVCYQKALDLVDEHPEPALRLEILSRIAYNCYARTSYKLAADYATECIELAKKTGNRSIEANCLGTMANIMGGYGGEAEKALAYARQSMELHQSLGDTGGIVRSQIRLANMQSEIGRVAEALQQMEETERWITPASDIRLVSEVLFWKGHFLMLQKEYAPALAAMQQALPLFEKQNDRFRVMHILLNFGTIYLEQGQAAKAVEVGRKIEEGTLRPGLYERNEAYKLLYQAYKQQGDAPSALRYHERYFLLNDSIRLFNKDNALAELDVRFQSKEKERQLEQQAQALSAEKSRKTGFLAGLVLTLAALGFSLFAFFKMRKAKSLLAEQNQVISSQKEALQHLDEMKSRFFANVSHELRTPLTLMLGPIGAALKSPQLDQRSAGMLQLARQHGKHLLKLVNEILDLTKLQAGKLELNETPLPLFPLLRRIAGYFHSHAERQGISFFFDYKADPELVLELDAARLETILNNLLSNAVKFTPPVAGAVVGVTVEDLAHAIRLRVSDTGKGIHPGDLPHVFDRFYQAPPRQEATLGRRQVVGGTGIGLALCRDLAELMQGKIWAESEVGKGSTFFFEFPKKEVFGAEHRLEDFDEEDLALFQPSTNFAPATVPATAPTLLLVEDNPSMRDYLRLVLSEKYKVLAVENGQAALELLNEDLPVVPDLVLSDIIMPEMDGYELLQKLKGHEQLRHLPVMLLTARADAKDQFKALRIGADDYLLKPFADDELLARVEALLQRKPDSRG